MEASIWMKSCSTRSSERTLRLSALMTPVVTVWEKPKGLPMAITVSPIMRSSLSPIGIAGSASLESIFSTARSESGSAPIRRASNSRSSCSTTLIVLARWTTWALVRIRPRLPSMMTPEPRLVCCWRRWNRGSKKSLKNSSKKGFPKPEKGFGRLRAS